MCVYRQSCSVSFRSVVLREGNWVVDDPENTWILWRWNQVTEALSHRKHNVTKTAFEMVMGVWSLRHHSERDASTGRFVYDTCCWAQISFLASVIYHFYTHSSNGPWTLHSKCCVSDCSSHRDRQDGTLILQIYHSNRNHGDVLQQLAERLTGGGQDGGEGWGREITLFLHL